MCMDLSNCWNKLLTSDLLKKIGESVFLRLLKWISILRNVTTNLPYQL